MKPQKRKRRDETSGTLHRPTTIRPHIAQEVRELNGGAIDDVTESLVHGLTGWARVCALGLS